MGARPAWQLEKKEVTPEGKPDKNVFDIQQGVSIIVAVKKNGKTSGVAKVYHGDLWGTRESKYEKMSEESLSICNKYVKTSKPWLLT